VKDPFDGKQPDHLRDAFASRSRLAAGPSRVARHLWGWRSASRAGRYAPVMRPDRRRHSALAVCAGPPALLAATLFTSGCAGPIADLAAQVPKKATSAAVQGGTNALSDPALRRQIAQALASPEMRDIQRELIAGLTDSTVAALGDEERLRRLDALATRAAERLLLGADRTLPRVTEGLTRGAVDGALDAALAPASQRKLQLAAGAFLDTGMRALTGGPESPGLAVGVSAAMTQQIGPAMEATMRDDIGPGLASVLANQELQRSLGETARLLGREIVLGATDALATQKPPPQADSFLSKASGVARQGAALFGTAAWVLVLVIALLFAWIVKLLAQARRLRSEATRQVAQARLLEESARAKT
jgi:hypothetical protein